MDPSTLQLTMVQATESSHLRQLTGLRFFAALAVMLSHLGFLKESDSPLRGLAHTIFYEGYAGVTFFFILSGFILSHTYQTKLASKTISRRKYFLLRLARIYPLHFLTALPFAIGAWYELGFNALPKILLNLALLQSWAPRSELYYSLNSVSWSLSNEIFFYSSFIFLTMLSTKALSRLILIWFAAIIFAAILGIYFDRASWSDGRVHYLFYINPTFRLLDFMVGMLIYRQFSARPPVNSGFHEFMSVTTLIAAMYCFSAYQLPDALRSQVLYLPIMAYMVWSYSGRGGLISRALSRPAIILLGDASFALYMIHQPIITQGVSAVRRYDIVIDSTLLALVLIVVGIVASIAIYKYIELPIHTRLRVWIGKLNTEQAPRVNG